LDSENFGEGSGDWESNTIDINFNKLKEKQTKGEYPGQVIDVKTVGEGFTRNLILSLQGTKEAEEVTKLRF
jgi:hypothetical protein